MMMLRRKLNISALGLLVASMSGCAGYMDSTGLRNETVYPAIYPVDNPAPPKTAGSIYQAGHQISLFDDRIAGRVGDIITVRLEETTQGQKRTKTKANKVAANTFTAPALLGLNEAVTTNLLGVETTSNQQFQGDGEANQQNRLRGTVSVTVMRVLSNNNLVVQGESWLTINQGREYVRLSGIIRRDDIEPNNMISSQRVADARISYSGNGQVADVSRGGVLTQFFNKFFPY